MTQEQQPEVGLPPFVVFGAATNVPPQDAADDDSEGDS